MLISIGKTSKEQPVGLIELLLECHQRIRKFIALAQKIAVAMMHRSEDTELLAKQRVEIVQACRDCVRYFVEALPLHVQDEELSLFPLLNGRSSSLDDVLSEMQRQHQSHEAKMQVFIEALRAIEMDPDSLEWGHRLQEIASELETEFEAHLQLEETSIFPQIPILLTNHQLENVRQELRVRRSKGEPRSGNPRPKDPASAE